MNHGVDILNHVTDKHESRRVGFVTSSLGVAGYIKYRVTFNVLFQNNKELEIGE